MHRRLAVLLLASIIFSTAAFAKDVYLSIGGSVNNFRTDARILNPSFDKDITIAARYLPTGGGDNSGVAPKNVVVPKRTMLIFDDVVQSLFGGGPAIGAVRLTSDDDFVATQRIYAITTPGTLGQFVPGLDVTQALRKGALIQIKISGLPGQQGTFRTNMGFVNPNAATANVTLKLYDKNNALAGTKTRQISPFGVLAPSAVTGYFDPTSADLSDAWVSYDSDQPLFGYISCLDNGTEDPTFITASADSGNAPPAPQEVTVDVTAVNWEFDVVPSAELKSGQTVKFRIKSNQDIHGFRLIGPANQVLIERDPITGTVFEQTIVLPSQGTYTYFCIHTTCGEGHTGMGGTFDVGVPTGPGDGY